MTKDEWLVVGNGAVGLLWASKLSALGNPVTIVHRSASQPESPIIVDFTNDAGEPQQSTHNVTFATRSELEGKYTKVLLCTKAFDLVPAYLDIREHTKKRGLIATLCNGMGAQQDLIPHLKKHQNLWAGTTSEGALKTASNGVRQTGNGDTFFGLLVEDEKNLFGNQFPYPGVQSENVEQRLLEKVAVNAIINPLTALFSIRNGQVLEPPIRPIFDAAIDELSSVMQDEKFKYRAYTLNLTPELLHMRVSTVAKLTAMNCSSMYEDVRNLRKTENEYISGFFHREANTPTPLQDFFYRALNDRPHLEEHKKKLLSMYQELSA
ncbi:ketopantoate reductase family protein [Rhodanobacter aciditrophus]|uniref:2-dehydropantoate 2-reductase n=1 Tax=Rhodanobacter aciditrophus TaxID=1623218 RepID=A0ABW4B2B8_9GAMM